MMRGQTETKIITIVKDGMILVEEKTHRPLYVGEKRSGMKILGGTPPRHSGSTGRVLVYEKGRAFDQAEYFPGVVDAEWIPFKG